MTPRQWAKLHNRMIIPHLALGFISYLTQNPTLIVLTVYGLILDGASTLVYWRCPSCKKSLRDLVQDYITLNTKIPHCPRCKAGID